MSLKIPPSFIDELILRTDIVTLIDAYVPLKKKGANYLACCPFHQEKTPSFSVSPQKQIYYCFGCGVGGNAIRFLMDYEHLHFMEALSVLAKQTGLELPQENKLFQASTELFDVMQQATQFYQLQLKKNTIAIDYLKSRGLTGEIAKEFQLGYAPEGWDNLSHHLGSQEQTKKNLLQVGLLIKKESGITYDRFRSRILFPIRDTKGRVIAFGGRVLTKEEPKYLNSPETPLFHKGKELYGLFEAKRALREINYFIVVEGYMDVLALAQYGIRNVVGTLGTATTAEHLTKLFRYTKKIIFCFDGDRAGKDAAWRALQVSLPFLEDGVDLRFMFLPEKEDPDSFIRTQGKEGFISTAKKAYSLSDFLFRHLTETIDLSTIEGKAAFNQKVSPLLAKIPEGALKQMMFEKLSHIVPLSTSKLRSLSRKNIKTTENVEKNKLSQSKSMLTPLRLTLVLLIQQPHLVKYVPETLLQKEWKHDESELFQAIVDVIQREPALTSATFLEHWSDKSSYPLISSLLMKEHFIPEDEIEKEFIKLLVRLEQQYKENKVEMMLLKAKTQGLSEEEKIQLKDLIVSTKDA